LPKARHGRLNLSAGLGNPQIDTRPSRLVGGFSCAEAGFFDTHGLLVLSLLRQEHIEGSGHVKSADAPIGLGVDQGQEFAESGMVHRAIEGRA
jgi:hypothetical protein